VAGFLLSVRCMDILLQQIINGLVLGSMYALVALGYTMVYGIINLINFAHGEVLMVGALTSWTIIIDAGGMPGTPGWIMLLIHCAGDCHGGVRRHSTSPLKSWLTDPCATRRGWHR
jgi:branched-subunit amino acid ABC-type transport system permease component